MTSRELHTWVEKQGVPAKWQLPMVTLLGRLLDEERVWPTIPVIACRGPLVDRVIVPMLWRYMTVNLFDDGAVKMFVRSDRGPGAQGIPLGADWVREVVRLAPKKPDELWRVCGPPTVLKNFKPAPEVVGGYKQEAAITPVGASSMVGWDRLYLPTAYTFHPVMSQPPWQTRLYEGIAAALAAPAIQRRRIRCTCDLSMMGVEQAIIDLHELGDAPVALVVGAIAADNWSWIFENRDLLAHHGIDLAACVKDPALGMDEWLLRGQRHEIYSEGA